MKFKQSRTTIGLVLATFGALFLTPDTLFMRLSQLDGWNMLVWRGGLSGLAIFLFGLWLAVDVDGQKPLRSTLLFLSSAKFSMLHFSV